MALFGVQYKAEQRKRSLYALHCNLNVSPKTFCNWNNKSTFIGKFCYPFEAQSFARIILLHFSCEIMNILGHVSSMLAKI